LVLNPPEKYVCHDLFQDFFEDKDGEEKRFKKVIFTGEK